MKVYITFLLVFTQILCMGQNTSQLPIPVEKFLKGKIRCADVNALIAYHQNNQISDRNIITEPTVKISYRDGEDDDMLNDAERSESEVHAALNPLDTNNIVVAVINQDPMSLEKPLFISIYHTHDFGISWEQSTFDGWKDNFLLPIGGGDPILSFDNNGRVYLTWLIFDANLATFTGNLGIYIAYSDDNGSNWTTYNDPIDISNDFNLLTLENAEYFIDKPWMTVDKSNGNYAGNLYLCYTRLYLNSKNRVNYEMVVKRQLEGNDAFENSEFIIADSTQFDFIQFASLDHSSNGDVHAVFVGSTDSINYAVYYVQSIDGGATFSEPQKLSDFILPGFTNDEVYEVTGIDPQRLYPCPAIKSSKGEDPVLYCTWNSTGLQSSASNSLNIYLCTSYDQGKTWNTPFVLNDDTGTDRHQYYASLETSYSGVFIVSFYDRRSDPDDNNTHQFIAISEDQGLSFLDQTPVSSEATDFSTVGTLNGNFGIGEYNVTLATDHVAMPFWADGRGNDGDVNIYFAKVGIQGGAVDVKEIQSISDNLIIYPIKPNPVIDQLSIAIDCNKSTECQFQIYNILGKLLYSSQKEMLISNHRFEKNIDCSQFKPGSYILKIESSVGRKSILFEKAD